MRKMFLYCLVILISSLALAPSIFSEEVENKYSMGGIDSGAEVVTFLKALQKAAAAGDKTTIATMIAYPLHAKVKVKGRLTAIKSKEAFLANYDEIFNPSVKDAIQKATPDNLFVNYQGVMIGNGQVWFTTVDKMVKIITVNN